MRWLIVGANGMLGQDFASELANKNCRLLTKLDCDVTNFAQVQKYIRDADFVVNCAAYTAVDEAESNRDLAFAINAEGPKNLALICKEIGAKLIQISTDYVFAGDSIKPYGEFDIPKPKSVYGASKYAGELEVQKILPNDHYIVRTAWLYGKHGNHFGKTILKLANTNETLKVVNDQTGQPTWTLDLAKKIIELVSVSAPVGTYHGTSQGQVTWFEYAKNLFELAGLDVARLQPVSSEMFPRPAPRPNFSVLGHSTFKPAGISPIRLWNESLAEAFKSGVFDV